MLNATVLLSDELGKRLSSVFLRTFGGIKPHIAAFLDEAARLVIERIGASDALYHDAEHTALVTLVVQDIVRGLRLRRTVSAEDWLHFIARDAPGCDGDRVAAPMTRQEASRRVQEAAGRFCPEPPPAALHGHTIDQHAKAVLKRLGALGRPSERLTAPEAIVAALPEDRWPVLFADCIIAEHRARHHQQWVKAAQSVSAQAAEAHKHLKAVTRYLNRPRHHQEWGSLSKEAREALPMMDVTDAGADPVADALHIVRSAIASRHRLAAEHLQLVSRKTTPEAARAEGIGWIRESLISGCRRAGRHLKPAWVSTIASAALNMGEITPDAVKQTPLYSDRLACLR